MTANALIVGSGPAALAAANATVAAGCSVLLLRRRSRIEMPTFGEHLAPDAIPLLEKLGLGFLLNDPRHCKSHGIVAHWADKEPLVRDYIFSPFGVGYNLDRAYFDNAMLEAVQSHGVQVCDISRIESVRWDGNAWTVSAIRPSGASRRFTTDFIVDASGRAAALVRRLGVRPKRYDRLVGMFVRHHDAASIDSNLVIEAVSEGWWYSAPLADGSLVTLFMTDFDSLPAGTAARHQYWLQRLDDSKATKLRIGASAGSARIHTTFAGSQCVPVHAGRRWVAIGDASMGFDPLSAVGMTKALRGGISVAEIVSEQGETCNFKHYNALQWQIFQDYLNDRSSTYRSEIRWPQSEFWRRRHKSKRID